MNDTPQLFRQKYLFHAHAVAIGGQVSGVRFDGGEEKTLPRPLAIDGASCALPINGGVVTSSRGKSATEHEGRNLLSFEYARARAEGHLEGDSAITRVSTDLFDLQVGSCKPLFIAEAHSELLSTHPLGAGAVPQFNVALRLAPIQFGSTKMKVVFKEKAPACEAGKIISLVDHIENPIGELLRGPNEAPRGVYHPDIGQILFGEAILTPTFQRVVLIRFEFGCQCKGGGTVGDTGGNGDPGFKNP